MAAAAIGCAAIAGGNATAGGIPVIDAGAISQQLVQIQHALTQIEQLKSQLETAQKQLDGMSGSRGLGSAINSEYDVGMEIDANAAMAEQGLRSSADYGLQGGDAAMFDGQNANAAEWLAKSDGALAQSQARFGELAKLIAKVNDSPDQKDILDLQARINAENAMLQNEAVKLSMMRSQAEARSETDRRKIIQMNLDTSGNLSDYEWK
jgi:type IV secretion system protein VirB5